MPSTSIRGFLKDLLPKRRANTSGASKADRETWLPTPSTSRALVSDLRDHSRYGSSGRALGPNRTRTHPGSEVDGRDWTSPFDRRARPYRGVLLAPPGQRGGFDHSANVERWAFANRSDGQCRSE